MKELFAYAASIREELHRIPELGFDLPKTLAVVRRELDSMGLSYTDRWGRSSLVGYLGPEDAPFTIGLRADMDALPIQEQTGLPYASTHEGMMHACGHDSHTAILLATLKYFTQNISQLKCRIKFLFTPAEEYAIPGCRELAENGVLDDVNCCLATHCSPDRSVGEILMTDQPMGANSMGFRVRFSGLSAHAASQQKGKDAILMAVEAITAMEFMVAKEIQVTKPRLLNIGSIHGGKTNNVICDEVEIFATARAHEDSVSEFMEQRIRQICQGVALSSGGRAEFERLKFLPYRINDPLVYRAAYASAVKELGQESIIPQRNRGLGGEDFGYLTRQKPCLFTFFGVKPRDVDSVPPVHNNCFAMPNESMETPIRLHIRFILDHMHGIEGL